MMKDIVSAVDQISPTATEVSDESRETIENILTLVRKADLALARHADSERTPKQRDEDFTEALHAHRAAANIWMRLQRTGVSDDAASRQLTDIAPELADLEIQLSQIRFDDAEITLRLPRMRV